MSTRDPYSACSASEVLSSRAPAAATWNLNRKGPEGVRGMTRER